jgi:DNA polymerase bacteriophage-type
MFGVDKAQLMLNLKACDKCGHCVDCIVRGKGKVSDLALGYAGGAGALVTMGAEGAGVDCGNYNDLHREWEQVGKPGKFHEWERDRHNYPELLRLRDLYRENRPATVRFWKNCARAWDIACSGKPVRFGQNQIITMLRDGRHNRLVLPSGRSIWYRFARAHADPNNPERIDRRTFIGKSQGVGHTRIDTHGGKLTENITQAIARDVLFDLLMKIQDMNRAGWPGLPVLHVHDEVVLEVPSRHADQVLADTLGLMSTPPDWATGLAVKGAGAIMERYGK